MKTNAGIILISIVLLSCIVWSIISYLSVGMFQSLTGFVLEAFASPKNFMSAWPTLFGLISGPLVLVAMIIAVLKSRI